MLDVAFDSVVTMDDRGVVLSVNRAAERLFGYRAADMVGRTVAETIIPESLREAHRHGLERYLRTGRGPVVGRRVELTAMRADGSEFPVELVVTRPEIPGAPVFYGYLRDLTARYVAEASLHRLADEQAALRRVATAVAAEHDPAQLFALVSEEVGRLLEARTAHMFRFDADGTGGSIIGGWGAAARARAPARHAHDARRRHRGHARVADRARGADGHLRGRRGRVGGADARVRRAGRRRRAGLPRRVAVGRGRGLLDGARAVPRRTPSSGSPTSPSWPRRRWRTRRRGRSSRRRAPGSWPRATLSAGGWSATCTTARSSGWCRSR